MAGHYALPVFLFLNAPPLILYQTELNQALPHLVEMENVNPKFRILSFQNMGQKTAYIWMVLQ